MERPPFLIIYSEYFVLNLLFPDGYVNLLPKITELVLLIYWINITGMYANMPIQVKLYGKRINEGLMMNYWLVKTEPEEYS